MSETKWTPGPWVVDGTVIRGDEDKFGRKVAIASTLNVAWPSGRCAIKEEPHNAHLIAAAPRLYGRLEKTTKMLHRLLNEVSHDSYVVLLDIIEENGEALAKARGES